MLEPHDANASHSKLETQITDAQKLFSTRNVKLIAELG